ncbi:MAG: cytochrome C [Deltaproteobacteria bacterium]|nr:MAG: cytochrome C [Deltaproteobacteria bacterium]
MKKLFVVLMLIAFATSATFAVAADSVSYDNKQGKVTFNHKAHGEKLKCDACHQGKPAKIEVNKDAAHGAVCKDCHKAKGGPTKCGDCHKK